MSTEADLEDVKISPLHERHFLLLCKNEIKSILAKAVFPERESPMINDIGDRSNWFVIASSLSYVLIYFSLSKFKISNVGQQKTSGNFILLPDGCFTKMSILFNCFIKLELGNTWRSSAYEFLLNASVYVFWCLYNLRFTSHWKSDVSIDDKVLSNL